MSNLRRRLQRLECHRREEQSYTPMLGEARRLLEEKIEGVRRRMLPAVDSGECAVSDATAEQVAEMLHAHFEESRIRREEHEKQSAVRRWGRASPSEGNA